MKFDRGLSIGLFLFAVWVLYLSINIPRTGVLQVVGPEVLPIGISVSLMAASVALFVRTQAVGDEKCGEALPEGVEREDRITQGLVLLGGVAYIFLLKPLGFVVTTTLFCFYETMVLKPGHWVRNALVAVGFSAAVYTLFVKVLEILLPVGILGW